MKISWPHMGSLEVVLASVFEELGLEYVPAPPNSERTLELGARYGPEFACFPLKTTLGNFIEAIEAGADTLIMVAGRGPCRFGYYAETQRRILEDAGYEFEMVPLTFHLGKMPLLMRQLRRLKQSASWTSLARAVKIALSKAYLIDRLEQQALHQRYLDRDKGATTSALKECYEMVFQCDGYDRLRRVEREGFELLHSVPKTERQPIKIGIIGEF